MRWQIFWSESADWACQLARHIIGAGDGMASTGLMGHMILFAQQIADRQGDRGDSEIGAVGYA